VTTCVLTLVPLPVSASSTIGQEATVTPYLNFQAAVLGIDEKTLNATVSIFLSAGVDNASAPPNLEIHVYQQNFPYFFLRTPIQSRNVDYAYYQMYEILGVPLGISKTVLFPYDNYLLNMSVEVRPYVFTAASKLSIDQLIIPPTLQNLSWEISSSNTTVGYVDSSGGVEISRLYAEISRKDFAVEEVTIPIYGILWLIGGTVALPVRKWNTDGVSNRLAVYVAAFIGMTGFSIIVNAHLPVNFTLPSMAAMLVNSAELAVVVLVFATFADTYIGSEIATLILDSLAIVLSLLVMTFYILTLHLTTYVNFTFQDLPALAKVMIVAGLSIGAAIRWLHWFYRAIGARLGQ
jgi:hypothetical protein